MRIVLPVLVFGSFLLAAEKPSPFVARTSTPAAPPAAPVSPVAPALSILRATRPKPFVAGGGVSPSVSPVARPGSAGAGSREVAAPPPPLEKVVPLKTTVLEVPVMAVASVRPPQVSEIEKGMAKDSVVSKLGNPSTVVSMYEDSRFLESLRYEWQGRWLGTVRLVNGQVSRVDRP
jgi:hypothetical protein